MLCDRNFFFLNLWVDNWNVIKFDEELVLRILLFLKYMWWFCIEVVGMVWKVFIMYLVGYLVMCDEFLKKICRVVM